MRPRVVSTAVTALELAPKAKPVTSTPVRMLTPAPFALSASPSIEARLLAYPPFFSCRMEVTPGACQSPKRLPHVARAVRLALDELGLVADRPLLRGDLGHVLVHALRADLHVAHGMVVVGLGIALPHLDAGRHQRAHRRLVVIVADHAAGDAGGAGGDRGFVHHRDIGAAAAARGLQRAGQMVGRAEAVDAGTDDEILDVGRKRHPSAPYVALAIPGADSSRGPYICQANFWPDRNDQL